jgi:anti-anti-sigma regulatory factor
MEFKIDTKDTFCIIMPDTNAVNANMADALAQKMEEMRQSGSKNFIVDLQHCQTMDADVAEALVNLHEESYSAEQSLVFTGINKEVMATLKQNETDLLINVAPKMEEAIDIISMEILERDLLSEE